MTEMKGYFVHDKDECTGVAVVAYTARGAKNIGYSSVNEITGAGWTKVAVKLVKNSDVSKFSGPRVLTDNEALRSGVCKWYDGVKCEICGKEEAKCEILHGRITCVDCIEKDGE